MKLELTNPPINLIKQLIERDLYNQKNQLHEYKIFLEEEFIYKESGEELSKEELQRRIDSLKFLINHLEILDKMFSIKNEFF